MASFPDRPGYSFNPGPPPEVSNFLANKGLQPAFSHRDVEPEEHAVAFSVAKAMQADVLGAIRAQVQRAIDEGRTLAQFRKDLRPELEKLGWWGTSEMVDPVTGKTRTVQLGSPRRLQTIYRSNLRSARAAGQWERIQRTKDALPYLLYQLGPSERHRAAHRAKNGLVLLADDPFWARWYPPNGWGCKCWVRQIDRAEAEDYGIGEAPGIPERAWTNPRTGEIRRVPSGLDPSWDRNPGALRQQHMAQVLAGKLDELDALDPGIAQVVARDIATSWRAERMMAGEATGSVPVALLSRELRDALGAETSVVQLRDDVAMKIREKHPEVGPDVLLRFQEAMASGAAAVKTAGERPSLLFFAPGDQDFMLTITHLADQRALWISAIEATTRQQWAARVARNGMTVLREGSPE